jgi:hypothetical protein
MARNVRVVTGSPGHCRDKAEAAPSFTGSLEYADARSRPRLFSSICEQPIAELSFQLATVL